MKILEHRILRIGIAPIRFVQQSNFEQKIELIPGKKWTILEGAYIHSKLEILEKISKGNTKNEISIRSKYLSNNQGLHNELRDTLFVSFIEYPNNQYKFFGSITNPLVRTLSYKGDYTTIRLKNSVLIEPYPITLTNFNVL